MDAEPLQRELAPGIECNHLTPGARPQDIEAVDPEYYKNLRWMLEHDIADVLDLTFTEELDFFGRKELVELKPGGAALKVGAPPRALSARAASMRRGLAEDVAHERLRALPQHAGVSCKAGVCLLGAHWAQRQGGPHTAAMRRERPCRAMPRQPPLERAPVCASGGPRADAPRPAAQVTEENKKEYVNLVAQHRMTTAIRGQLHAFLSGFWDLVPKARPPPCVPLIKTPRFAGSWQSCRPCCRPRTPARAGRVATRLPARRAPPAALHAQQVLLNVRDKPQSSSSERRLHTSVVLGEPAPGRDARRTSLRCSTTMSWSS